MSSLHKLLDPGDIAAEIIENPQAALEDLRAIAADLEDAPENRLLDDKS